VFDQYLRQDARRPQPAPAANDAKAVPIQRYSRVV